MPLQQVLKWGKSLALRIPASIARRMKVGAGWKVEMRLEGTRLVIEPAAEELPGFTQADLLKALKKSRRQRDPLGPRRGREEL